MKKYLILRIEEHLGWGSGSSWTHRDFTQLSEKILDVTGKQLSVTTLKRVWGRTTTIASPSAATFDILSEFIGFDNWRHFQREYGSGKTALKKKGARLHFWKWGLGALGLGLLTFVIWSQSKVPIEKTAPSKNRLASKAVLFELNKVATGYPNTVIFRYDYGDLDYDSISIQQSWDVRKQIPLKEAKGLVTSTYYRPGYFLAKLIADGQILEERDLYIPTDGWQGMVSGNGELSYLKPGELHDRNSVGIAPEILNELEEMDDGKLYLAHLSPAPDIDGSDFELTTSFRMAKAMESSICHNVRMTITGTREVISLAFSRPGCVGDLSFFIDKGMVSGKNHDFSAFGRDTDQWTHCRMRVNKGFLKVFVEQQEVYSKELTVDLGKIGGVQWYFEGLGEINELRLADEQQEIDLVGPEQKSAQ
ncbi:hypothetical protein [Allomuricauda sp. SCSIO 65647]|uniref:hypothetical protein n=1 Tax=Allomuricauda sp. SCSIO 65647 TaxID=2908843 RepID=UPI001F1BF22C|nr:hypothetical protein [Muricauda sp. SCSIO 65647]UJH67686.1 hypothetical protein L0P89_00360 [Muricauda sp. SCSIO 65647]